MSEQKYKIPPRFWLPADFFDDTEVWGYCHETSELADKTSWFADETDEHELVECIRADLDATRRQELADALEPVLHRLEDEIDGQDDPDEVAVWVAQYIDPVKAVLRYLREQIYIRADLDATRRQELANLLEIAKCPNRCNDGMIINTGPDPVYEPCQFCYERDMHIRALREPYTSKGDAT